MKQIYGARAIVNCLEREGIEIVFGIPGLYNMPIFDALYRHPPSAWLRCDMSKGPRLWQMATPEPRVNQPRFARCPDLV